MKYVLTILTALLLFASSGSPVFAGESNTPISWYGRVSLGFAEQMKKYIEVNHGESEWAFKSGMNYTVAAGYVVPYFALEGEFSYSKLDANKRFNRDGSPSVKYVGDQTQVALMINGYFIPKPEWKISPHIGLGIGATIISWNDVRAPGGSSVTDDSDTVFTYQLIAGASYKINPQFTVVADYRYFVPGDIEIDMDGAESKLNNQELQIVGVSLRFKL
jgi:opacity protein-like surface antigen